MEVIPIMNPKQKQSIARAILEDLTDWFGLEESREEYIEQAAHLPFLCAMEDQQPVGFLCLKQTGKDTAEIQVMGVLQDRHGHGIGKALVDQARGMARKMGCSFLQVKTVQMGKYPEYDATNRFYLAMGFGEFEVFPNLWDPWNPCQIYVLSLKDPKN